MGIGRRFCVIFLSLLPSLLLVKQNVKESSKPLGEYKGTVIYYGSLFYFPFKASRR